MGSLCSYLSDPQEEEEFNESQTDNAGEDASSSASSSSGPEMLAEVVLLVTSLGGLKKQLFESTRAQHLLDCKGLVYYLVDANKDISAATVVLPQVLIDGVSVGDQKFLQDLEDDGDLDYIVARLICPSCLADKETDALSCPKCKVEYRNMIPEEYVDTEHVRRFCQGQLC